MHARALIAGLAFAVLVLVGFLPAHEALASNEPVAGNNRGWTDGKGVAAEATVTQEGPAPQALPTAVATGPVCTYEKLPPDEAAIGDRLASDGSGPPKGSGPGTWYAKMCVDEVANRSSGTVVWLPERGAEPPEALARQALQYTPLSPPLVSMSPSSSQDQLVNLPTWLWLDRSVWKPVSASASAGGVRVTTIAVPTRVTWDMGDGATVACDGPGTPFDPSRPTATPTCAYTYHRPTERAVVTATIEWAVQWTSTTGAVGDLGVVRRSSSVPVRVAESQAINVSAAGRPS